MHPAFLCDYLHRLSFLFVPLCHQNHQDYEESSSDIVVVCGMDADKKATFKEVYAGKTIPEKYESEVFRCDQQAQRIILLFKGIDQNSYLPL